MTIGIFALLLVGGFMLSKAFFQKESVVVTNFNQCVSAGFKVINTVPRKCITDDDKVFADDGDNDARHAEKVVSTFEECVEAGYEVKNTFPRECISPDGDSFIESVVRGAEDERADYVLEAENYCKENGGVVRISYSDSGNQYFCELVNGKKCEVEAFYNGLCN